MNKSRFKIDVNDWSSIAIYSLYVKVWSGFFFKTHTWKELKTFETREEAREYYEKIKDLPEYLP